MKKNETSQQTNIIKSEYKKSNFLISSMSKGGLLENQLNAIGLQKIFTGHYFEDKETKSQVVRVTASEIRKLLNTNSGSFYAKLANVAQAATGRIIGFINPENQTFDFLPINSRMSYSGGTLEIRYNSELKSYLTNLKTNFTVLNLETMLSFKSLYSFRLYELLKSKAFYQKYENHEHRIHIYYSVAELKLKLGIVDPEDPIIKAELDKNPAPDYEKVVAVYEEEQKAKAEAAVRIMEERLKDKDITPKEKKTLLIKEKQKYFPTYCEWRVLKGEMLDPALAEIEKLADDIDIEYELRKNGRGGKVTGIDFFVAIPETKIQTKEKEELSEDAKLDILEQIGDIVDIPLKIKDLRTIAEAAEYDVMKVKKANMALTKCNNVTNPVGFLISAIKEEYECIDIVDVEYKEVLAKDKKLKKNSKAVNAFNQFKQAEYDMTEIEKLIANEN